MCIAYSDMSQPVNQAQLLTLTEDTGVDNLLNTLCMHTDTVHTHKHKHELEVNESGFSQKADPTLTTTTDMMMVTMLVLLV